MRSTILAILTTLITFCGLKAQNTMVRFIGQSQNGVYMRLDSVAIRDYSQQWEQTIFYPDTVMIAILNSIENEEYANFSVSQNSPNPFMAKA